ncbi:MAG: PhzF family phenazine biosynthesis protein [Terriglobia bacterium]
MGIPILHVDAFTSKPFAGNPAAICLLPEPRSEDWMRSVAGEMNLSETAFLLRQADGFKLRWFTPKVEAELCGHATLASAHALWEWGELEAGAQARFHTRSGLLTAERKGDWIELNFPAEREQPAPAPPELARALGAQPTYVGKNRMDYLVEVESEEVVRALRPDFALLERVAARGVIVTSRSASSEFDFVSRFFGPQSGVPEDPVTGSAHCCLGPYWQKKLNKGEFVAYQASARGGLVRVRLEGDRVRLGGQAVTVLRGELV